MNDDKSPPDPKHKPLRIDLGKLNRQTPVETDELGRVYARSPTMAMADAFCDRLKEVGADDFTVARIFMGCSTGKPTGDDKAVSKPLSKAESAKLSDNDVRRFAAAYLTDILGEKDPDADPIARIAEHARGELKQYQESRKKLAETVAASLRPIRTMYKDVFETAKQMQSWNQLATSAGALAAALKSNPLGKIGETVRQFDALPHSRPGAVSARPEPIDLSAFKPPPVEKTPGGRTMLAAESALEAVTRIEAAINVIVTQAGNVSELIGRVIKEIEDQGGKMQARTEAQTNRALRYARWSLVVSATALAVSAVFSALTYFQGRNAAHEAAQDTRALVIQAQRQSESLAKLVERTALPSARKATPASSSAGVQRLPLPTTPDGHGKDRD
jgi:hypothetical protein